MTVRRVAIIFDNKVRPDTTGVYCRRALGQRLDVEHFLPDELGRIPRQGFDLYLNIDDGLRYRLPRGLRPSAWWAIDTHLDLPWYLSKAPDFDFVFAAQRDGAAEMRRLGIASARWLPLACDPEIHRKHDVAKQFDVCFIGHPAPGPRMALVRLLQRRFPNNFVAQRFFEEMARTYSASQIVFNRSIRSDVNMRVFEALACGSLLLTNDLTDNGQSELFRDGVHLATYADAEELLDKAAFYLKRETIRERIAAAGRQAVLAGHTYRHRMEEILRQVESMALVSAHSSSRTLATRRPATESRTSPARLSLPTSKRPRHGLTSIVVVTHNELACTRACVESIRAQTRVPYELVFVDNASSDGTLGYLRRLGSVRVIANRHNLGFPVAANQGIRASLGRQVLVLNNDTLVTTGWLERMLTALGGDPKIGLVGPCSNRISGPQQVPVTYGERLDGLDAFAQDWAEKHAGERTDTDRLVGFCLLVRREVIDAIGLMDEGFGLGCFEDDDYCLRALAAGWRAVIARDAFVHHEGSRTFQGSGVDFEALMRRNEELFREKWRGQNAGAGTQRAGYRLRLAPRGGLLLERGAVGLSLAMIVRDSARTLEAALASIRPWVDEMVVVDTGSVDETPEIARRSGARVYHFPWCDDFSAARNESLRLARGEWIFWMDSDDTIDAENGRRLRELALGDHDPSVLGYVVQVHCPGPPTDGEPDVTEVDHVKLIRNRPELRFEHRIHEQILPAIRRAGGEVVFTDLFVTHSGYDHSPEGQAKKRQRDLRLLHLELQERPDHPFTLFNLGMTYADIGECERAVAYLRSSIAHSGPDESHVRKAYALLVYAYIQLGRHDDAWAACQEGLDRFPQDVELQFREALLCQRQGRLEEAAAAYRRVLAGDDRRHFTSIDRGIADIKARQNLAIVLCELGRDAEAEAEWRLVIRQAPGYRPGWRGLADVLFERGLLEEARALTKEMRELGGQESEALVVEARIAAAQGDVASATRHLAEARRRFPGDREPLRALCRILFEGDRLDEAARALRELRQREPEDGSVPHNLGTVCLRQGRYEEAIEAYRESLRRRPDSAQTYVYLGCALREAGRAGEAESAWSAARRLEREVRIPSGAVGG